MLVKDVCNFIREKNNGIKDVYQLIDDMKETEFFIAHKKQCIINDLTLLCEDSQNTDDLKDTLFLIGKICEFEAPNNKYNYKNAVKNDIRKYIESHKLYLGDCETINQIYRFYDNDEDLLNYVSGNTFGEYFSECEEAEKALYNNLDLVKESVYYFNIDYMDIIEMSSLNIDSIVRSFLFESLLIIVIAEIYEEDI